MFRDLCFGSRQMTHFLAVHCSLQNCSTQFEMPSFPTLYQIRTQIVDFDRTMHMLQTILAPLGILGRQASKKKKEFCQKFDQPTYPYNEPFGNSAHFLLFTNLLRLMRITQQARRLKTFYGFRLDKSQRICTTITFRP